MQQDYLGSTDCEGTNSLIASKAQGTAVQSIGECRGNMLFCGNQVLQQPKGHGVQPALC